LLKEQEELRRIRLQELKREISIGVKQLENGQGETYKSASALIDRLKAEGRKRRGDKRSVTISMNAVSAASGFSKTGWLERCSAEDERRVSRR
jgi:hypothetical protein